MVCIYCSSKTEIINSRHLVRSNTTWRRRRCLKCKAVMTSFEVADYSKLWSVDDKNYKPTAFIRDRLYISVYDSLRHRKTAIDDANSITNTIMTKLAKNSPDGRINRDFLYKTVLGCLKQFDKAAAVHYQAYYTE